MLALLAVAGLRALRVLPQPAATAVMELRLQIIFIADRGAGAAAPEIVVRAAMAGQAVLRRAEEGAGVAELLPAALGVPAAAARFACGATADGALCHPLRQPRDERR